MLFDLHDEYLSWDAVADHFGLTKPLVWRVANKHYEPKNPTIRHRLGLPALASAPVCAKCGELHVTKRCTKVTTTAKPKRARPKLESTMPKIKGQPYTVRAVIPWEWIAPAHPAGPPLVVVEVKEPQP